MRDERTKAILERLQKALLHERILDNTIRGTWCEFMIAQALGDECRAVGIGWNAWDLQLGPSDGAFPDRIRIQVKNSARLQVWSRDGKSSDSIFDMKYRRRPPYFNRDNPNTPCEEAGFLCDMYVLCYHPVVDERFVDQLDVSQWLFYLLPVVGAHSIVTTAELAWAATKLESTGRPASCQRRPDTLEKGIRGRPPVQPITFEKLTVRAVRQALGLTPLEPALISTPNSEPYPTT